MLFQSRALSANFRPQCRTHPPAPGLRTTPRARPPVKNGRSRSPRRAQSRAHPRNAMCKPTPHLPDTVCPWTGNAAQSAARRYVGQKQYHCNMRRCNTTHNAIRCNTLHALCDNTISCIITVALQHTMINTMRCGITHSCITHHAFMN